MTARLLALFFLMVAVCNCVNLPTLNVTNVSTEPERNTARYNLFFAATEDRLMTWDYIAETFSIYKRDAGRQYNIIGSYKTSMGVSYVSASGEWYSAAGLEGHELWKLDESGKPTAQSKIVPASPSGIGQLYKDGSYVIATPNGILTYKYESSAWSFKSNQTIEGVLLPSAVNSPALLKMYEQGMAFIDADRTFKILKRDSDGTWSLYGSFQTKEEYTPPLVNVMWDGANTVFIPLLTWLTEGETVGAIVIFSRDSNGKWSETQKFTAADFNMTGNAWFSFSYDMPDENTFVVSAPYDGSSGVDISFSSMDNKNGGSVIVFKKQSDGSWKPTLKFRPDNNNKAGFLGIGVVSNDYDVLVYRCRYNESYVLAFECFADAFPSCSYSPIDVTCKTDVILDSCSNPLESGNPIFNVEGNDNNCGDITTVEAIWSVQKNTMKVDLTFSRVGQDDIVCNLTLACGSASALSAGLLLLISFLFL